jgi:pimeloyl-ACP methyl ester carboxylesterase
VSYSSRTLGLCRGVWLYYPFGAYGVEGGLAMALPALVLVHGGGLAADSWELTVDEIHRVAPELTVLALDMPGRRNKPGDLREMTIADFVDSLVGDIECAGLEDVVLVGHSIGGMTLPGMATKLGAARVREMIFAAAFLPPEGASLVDSLPWLLARIARRFATRGVPSETPRWLARFAYFERNSLASPPIHDRQALLGITSHPHRECVLARNA